MMQQRAARGDARVLLGGAGLRGELQQVPVAAELGWVCAWAAGRQGAGADVELRHRGGKW